MTAPRYRISPRHNLKWSEMRSNSGRFASIADCAHHCIPSLRACAGLFYGSKAGGDALMEDFLASVMNGPQSGGELDTPAGLARAFEQYLRERFGDRPQRIALSASPSAPEGVWMSVDEFFDTLAHI